MTLLPERAAVLGSGGGALTIAAELGLAGVEVTLTDNPASLPASMRWPQPRSTRGFEGEPTAGTHRTNVDVPSRPSGIVFGSSRCLRSGIVPWPNFSHHAWSKDDFAVGRGGRWLLRNHRRPPGPEEEFRFVVGSTNSLPYGGPGSRPRDGQRSQKIGSTYLAGLPSGSTSDSWPLLVSSGLGGTSRQRLGDLLLNFNASITSQQW